MINITEKLSIPEEELNFTATRSGGPGGQNVNKVNSRVTLFFDVDRSSVLSSEQKRLIHMHLASRLSKEGVLHIVSQQSRSQPENKTFAIERFIELIREAIKPIPIRRNTKKTRGSQERRLKQKRHLSQIKKDRSKQVDFD